MSSSFLGEPARPQWRDLAACVSAALSIRSATSLIHSPLHFPLSSGLPVSLSRARALSPLHRRSRESSRLVGDDRRG